MASNDKSEGNPRAGDEGPGDESLPDEAPLTSEVPTPSDASSRELLLPSDPKTVFLGGLFLLAVLTVLQVAAEVVLPVILAFILKMLLWPAFRLLEKLRLPRSVTALALVLGLFSGIVGIGAALSGPAASWADKLPEGIPRLEERLSFLSEPIDAVRRFLRQAEHLATVSDDAASTEAVAEPAPPPSWGLSEILLTGTRDLLAGLLTTLLVLFFLLISGDIFLRRLVEILPRFRNKRQAVDIAQQIEHDISLYLMTVTLMNAIVGVATGLIMWLCGVGDPLLWGVVAFLLNYIPILGPIFATAVFLLAGLLSVEVLWQALLPAALYFLVHLIEGEAVTPMLLARRFTLNPTLVILSLIFWYWMWGVPGAILAVPMLAIAKLVCSRIRPLAAFGHFLTA